MTTWVPVSKPAVDVMVVMPTPDLVRRCGIAWCPGVRLSANLLAVKDSQGFYTQFYRSLQGLIYARVIDPQGSAQWLQELRVLPERGENNNG